VPVNLPDDETATLRARIAWFSYRSVACHLALSVLLPAFVVATWWQVERAASGNPLSYLYAVEWPAFAIVAVWAWWQIVHLPPPGDDAWKKPPPSPIWLSWDRKLETAELRSYNSYLVQLHVSGRYQRWRAPRLDKGDTPLEINGTGGAEAP
jgi:hypothetical protein